MCTQLNEITPNPPQIGVTTTLPPSKTATLRSMLITPSTQLPISNCLNDGFSIKAPTDFRIPGRILFKPYLSGYVGSIGGTPLTQSIVYSAEKKEIQPLGVSPDGNWFAFATLEVDPNKTSNSKINMVILSNTGNKIERGMDVTQFEQEFLGDEFVGFGPTYWINDNLIYTHLLLQNPVKEASIPWSIPKILNPFKGIWDETSFVSIQIWDGKTEIGISPSLDKVLYQNGQSIVIENLPSKTRIWSMTGVYLSIPESKVRWSPSGNFVAISERYRSRSFSNGYQRIIVITADGKTKDILEFNDDDIWYLDFEWSPDSKTILIYNAFASTSAQTFYIYDVSKKQIVSKCPIREQPWDVRFTWSPDSKMVVYGALEGFLQIWDVVSGRVVRVEVENVLPVGWIKD